MIIELTLLCCCRYRERRLQQHLARYPDYLLRDMGLRIEGGRVISDRDEPTLSQQEILQPPKRSTRFVKWWASRMHN